MATWRTRCSTARTTRRWRRWPASPTSASPSPIPTPAATLTRTSPSTRRRGRCASCREDLRDGAAPYPMERASAAARAYCALLVTHDVHGLGFELARFAQVTGRSEPRHLGAQRHDPREVGVGNA